MKTIASFSGLVWRDMSAAEYHKLPSLGSSFLKTARRDGWYVARHRGNESSPAMLLGSAIHAVLDGTFERDYRSAPAEYKTTTSQKFERWATELSDTGLIGISQRDYDLARECGTAILRGLDSLHFGFQRLVEATFLWVEETEYGPVPCKCRPDILQCLGPTAGKYVEAKTAARNGLADWRSSCRRYEYALQQAHYEAGLRACGLSDVETVFAVARTTDPICVRKYRIDDMDAAAAHRIWREMVTEYARRMSQDDWADDSWSSPTRVDLGLYVPDNLEEVECE